MKLLLRCTATRMSGGGLVHTKKMKHCVRVNGSASPIRGASKDFWQTHRPTSQIQKVKASQNSCTTRAGPSYTYIYKIYSHNQIKHEATHTFSFCYNGDWSESGLDAHTASNTGIVARPQILTQAVAVGTRAHPTPRGRAGQKFYSQSNTKLHVTDNQT